MGIRNICKLGAILYFVAAAPNSSQAKYTIPDLALNLPCRWLMLKTQESLGKSPMEVQWTEIYSTIREIAESKVETSGVLPEIVASDNSIRKNFGRLSSGHRDQIIHQVISRSYKDFAAATEKFKAALDDLHSLILTKPTDLKSTIDAWELAQKAENYAVMREHRLIAYIESTENLLGDLAKPHLSLYKTLNLRPEYESLYWHISPPLAEKMILMSMRDHTHWEFSPHALEQSDLRGYSEALIRKGLSTGKFSVIEARPEDQANWRQQPHTNQTLRFKVEITDFSHENRPKKLIIIVKFERNHNPMKPFKTIVVTTWNANMSDRYREAMLLAAERNKISLNNQKFKKKYKEASHFLIHELTYYNITEQRAQTLIESLVKGMGHENARVILRTTTDFVKLEMPKARAGETIHQVYQDLYNRPL
jgi:hypothetical protein